MKTRTYSESSSTPRASTSDLRKVGQDREARLVAQRDVDDAVMRQGRQSSNNRALLSTTWSTSRDKDTSILSPVCARSPLTSSRIPECLPLRGEVTITGGDTEEESVVLLEGGGVDDGDVGGFGWCVHLGENFLGEGLGDSWAG